MKIILDTEEIKKVLNDYAFNNFGTQLGVKSIEEIEIDIDVTYSSIKKMTIEKKEIPETEMTGSTIADNVTK